MLRLRVPKSTGHRKALRGPFRGKKVVGESPLFRVGVNSIMTPFVNPLRFCHALNKLISDDAVLIGDGDDFVGTSC